MNLVQAIEMVREITNRGRVLRDPELSRALSIVLGAAQREAAADAAEETERLISNEKRNGKTGIQTLDREWSKAEDDQLLLELETHESAGQIAKAHRRTLTSLMKRVVFLGKAHDLVEAFRLLARPTKFPKRRIRRSFRARSR